MTWAVTQHTSTCLSSSSCLHWFPVWVLMSQPEVYSHTFLLFRHTHYDLSCCCLSRRQLLWLHWHAFHRQPSACCCVFGGYLPAPAAFVPTWFPHDICSSKDDHQFLSSPLVWCGCKWAWASASFCRSGADEPQSETSRQIFSFKLQRRSSNLPRRGVACVVVTVQTGAQVSGGNMAAEEQNLSSKVTTGNIFLHLKRLWPVLKHNLSEWREAPDFVKCHVSLIKVCDGELMRQSAPTLYTCLLCDVTKSFLIQFLSADSTDECERALRWDQEAFKHVWWIYMCFCFHLKFHIYILCYSEPNLSFLDLHSCFSSFVFWPDFVLLFVFLGSAAPFPTFHDNTCHAGCYR